MVKFAANTRERYNCTKNPLLRAHTMSIPNEALQKVSLYIYSTPPYATGASTIRQLSGRESYTADRPLDDCEIKLAREIETQAIAAQQQIGLARTQIATKQREQRLVRLTLDELANLPRDAVVYEGLGKMYVVPRTYQASLPRCHLAHTRIRQSQTSPIAHQTMAERTGLPHPLYLICDKS